MIQIRSTILFVVITALAVKPGQSQEDIKCIDEKEPGLTWEAFCRQVLNRQCQEAQGADPQCSQCLPGFADEGSTVCVAKKSCSEAREDGTTWAAFCANTKQECDETGSEPKCKDCLNGRRLNPQTLRCEWQQTCWDVKENNIRWIYFCAQQEKQCDSPNETGQWLPICKECTGAYTFNRVTRLCDNRTTCQSPKENTKKWKEYCLDRGQECVDPNKTNSQGPACQDCLLGFLVNPQTFTCGWKVRKSCWDLKVPNQRWIDFCAESKQMCEEALVDGQWEPVCKDCPDGEVLDSLSPCNRYTCRSVKEGSTSLMGSNAKEVRGELKCVCKTANKEGDARECTCDQIRLRLRGNTHLELEEHQVLELLRYLSTNNDTKLSLS